MTDQIDKMRRTAASEMMSNLEEILIENPMKVPTAIRASGLWFVDDEYIDLWNKKLSSLDRQYIDTLKPSERRVFIQHINQQFPKKLATLDPLTRTFAMSYNSKRRGIQWKFPDCLLWNFDFEGASQGTYGCIDGTPRSGKTSFACLLMPYFDRLGIEVITNIAIKDHPEYIHITKRLSGTVKKMVELKKWVLILDETATYVDKKLALSHSNIDFENLGRFVGKMGGRLIMITHSFDRDIPTRLQDWTTERFTKIDKKTASIRLIGEKFKFMNYVVNIPDAELKYVTEDITSLNFDLSIKELLERTQDTKENILDIIEDIKKKVLNRPLTNEAKIRMLLRKHPDITEKEIAKQIGCSQANVNYLKKKIREKKKQ